MKNQYERDSAPSPDEMNDRLINKIMRARWEVGKIRQSERHGREVMAAQLVNAKTARRLLIQMVCDLDDMVQKVSGDEIQGDAE